LSVGRSEAGKGSKHEGDDCHREAAEAWHLEDWQGQTMQGIESMIIFTKEQQQQQASNSSERKSVLKYCKKETSWKNPRVLEKAFL